MSADPTTPPLLAALPPRDQADPDTILNNFLEAMIERGLELYPAQEEAILELMSGKHVILNTPTGSGKSLVAEALHFKHMAEGRRSYYTCPIKALVSEKFFALCDQFGADNVGMMTGDFTINRDAPIICCTQEILTNMALREGAGADIDAAVLDEFHYYSDRDRGVAWQVPLLTLPQTTFLLMSATLGDCPDIERSLRERSGVEVATVRSFERPVPLDFQYSERFIHGTIDELVEAGRAPIYVVNFTQRECGEQAQNLMSATICSKEAKKQIGDALKEFRFDTGYGRELQRFVCHGVGVHHAGLLPKYRRLVEQLSQTGLLKVICGTDTLGVGVNIPIRTVLFAKLCKYDGEKVGILSVRDFKQIAGRAGRKGFDDQGYVVCQAPEYVVENKKLEEKIASGAKKRQKVVKKKPPERNFVNWEESTFRRLVEQPPEPLRSRFEVSHAMVLNLIQGGIDHDTNGYRALIDLIAASHETDHAKAQHRREAARLFKSLVQAGVVSVVRNPETGPRLVINTDLQRDFSLNHSLSLYLLDALPRLDPELETYPLDVLTLVEAILENPRPILMRQVDKLFEARLAELKAEGMEYDERMEELKKLEHPKPNREFIYDTFNSFAQKHPWVAGDHIRPKSVAREMYERYCTFNEYVSEYGVARVEGLLLRYLSDAYRTLVQNVPDEFKDEAVYDVLAFLRTTLRAVDSSLIQEWEQLRDPGSAPLPDELREARRKKRLVFDPEVNPRAFAARLRSEVHRLVRALARREFEQAALALRPLEQDPWDAKRLEAALAPFFEEYEALRFDHQARLAEHTFVDQTGPRQWRVRQVLLDPEDDKQWMLEGEVDLSGEVDGELPLVALTKIGV